ncbi:MAG: phosphate acyltransferase PlsX [bacterium]|nr:phosphate acyltransferase PlsX [bacterium]
MKKIIIGLDAMGGDNAPQMVIEASKSLLLEKDIDILFIGDREKLTGHLPEDKIVHAPSVISCSELPEDAFRKKKDSSIAIGTMLQKEGKIDAFVSAGSTGACVMFSLLTLGRLKGVRRPALGIFFPTKSGNFTFILDVGAVTLVKPYDLYQFGVMGAKCIEKLTGNNNPKVAILSVGEESVKGSPLTKEAFDIMKKSKLNFIGNIEGHQIIEGISDVVVCDGMVGNILLKLAESVLSTFKDVIKKTIDSSIWAKMGGALIAGALRREFGKFNYEQYGGAFLLGVKGVTIISHGRSSAEAIKSAVHTAASYVKEGVNEYIEETLIKDENVDQSPDSLSN